MHCPRCEVDTPDGVKFRIECGAPLKPRCPQGGANPPPRAKFCAECGTPLTGQTPTSPPAYPQLPLSYTATHFAEQILTSFLGLAYLPYMALRLRTGIIAVMRWRRCCASKRRASGVPGSQYGRSD
jgi:Double zinc ribbon